jgi:ElaB/YqjD/DUF883 family membrane-anchored ribosome-binding protein
MNGNDFYSQTADWVVNTARRKPEALLLVAAGVALMMRSGSGFTSSWSRTGDTYGRASWQDETMTSGARAGVDRATDEASRHASGMRDRVRDTASAYASTVGDYAQDARRRMGEYTGAVRENLSSATDQVARSAQTAARSAANTLREQPLLIAALGIATGAAVAALFPATDIERRTLGPAGEALVGAAGAAGRDFMERAARTGEEVRRAAEDGLKDMAHQAADSFNRGESSGFNRGEPSGSNPPRSGTGV